jgi:hypothetical protein
MSALAASSTVERGQIGIRTALRRAQVALALGAAGGVLLAGINLFATTTSGDGRFQHAGDYWLTADGIPCMLALLLLLPSLRALQARRDGRLGATGIAVASIGAIVLLATFVYGLAAATASSLGPTYLLAALATLVGVALFAAASWRTGLLPRWLLVAWILTFAIGSAVPIPGPGPLLLAAAYVTIAITLGRRAAR